MGQEWNSFLLFLARPGLTTCLVHKELEEQSGLCPLSWQLLECSLWGGR